MPADYTPGPIRVQEIGGIWDLRTGSGRSVACALREPDARLYSLAPEMAELLHRIAYEPIGDAEATDRQVLDAITETARTLLAKVSP